MSRYAGNKRRLYTDPRSVGRKSTSENGTTDCPSEPNKTDNGHSISSLPQCEQVSHNDISHGEHATTTTTLNCAANQQRFSALRSTAYYRADRLSTVKRLISGVSHRPLDFKLTNRPSVTRMIALRPNAFEKAAKTGWHTAELRTKLVPHQYA